MKKEHILKKSRDFDRIIKSHKSYVYKDFIFYLENNKSNEYHFGFSVGKKIGNAVTRNKIKRQLKDIIDKNNYENGFNCIIIVRRGILFKSYENKRKDLNEALYKLGVIKGESNEKK